MNIKTIKKKIELQSFVESESNAGMYYEVTLDGNGWECTCPQHQKKGIQCKHITTVRDQEGL